MTKIRAVWFFGAISLLWALLLAIDAVPFLRGGYGWRWPYQVPDPHFRLLPLVMTVVLVVAVGWWLMRLPSSRWLLLWAILGGVGITLASVYRSESDVHFELYARTISGGTTGWHYAAADMDDDTLSEWPSFMSRYEGFSSHMTTSPPGMPLIYYGLNELLEQNEGLADTFGQPLRADQCHNDRVVGYSLHPGYSNAELASAWLGTLMPFWAALTVLPLYWVGRRFYGDQAARLSVLWWPIVPSVVMFTPNPTPVYALLSLVTIGLLAEGLRRDQMAWVLAAGVVMSGTTFLHFTPLPIIFLAGLFTLIYYWRISGQNRIAWPLQVGLWFGLGLVSVWIIYYLVFGVTVFQIVEQAFDAHLDLDRPYFPWLFLHLNDFFMFSGWILVMLAGAGLWQMRKRWSQPGFLLGLSAFATLLLMDVSGTTQGESGRIWLFMTPFVLLLAASYIYDHELSLLVTGIQSVILIVMVSYVHVIDSGLQKPPSKPPPIDQVSSAPIIVSDAVWDDAIQLKSFGGFVEGPYLVLLLEWQSLKQVEAPYYQSFIPVAPTGEAASQATLLQPFETEFPMTCWLPDVGLIRQRVEIPIFDHGGLEGEWWVSVAMVDGQTGRTLSVRNTDGERDRQIGIGPFR